MAKKKIIGPDLDKYLEGRKKSYVTYIEGYQLYSMPYYSFVNLAREAGATLKRGKKACVDLEILDEYLATLRDKEDSDYGQKESIG